MIEEGVLALAVHGADTQISDENAFTMRQKYRLFKIRSHLYIPGI